MDAEQARKARAEARKNLPIRRVKLTDESAPDVSHRSISERIAMVWEVTLDAWASSGKAMPDYTRANMPGRMIRGRRDDVDDADVLEPIERA